MKYYVHKVYLPYSYTRTKTGKESQNYKLGTLQYVIQEFDTFEQAYKAWSPCSTEHNRACLISTSRTKFSVGKSKEYHSTGRKYPVVYFQIKMYTYRLNWEYIETEVEYGLEHRESTVLLTNSVEAYQEANKFVDRFWDKREQLTWNVKLVA